MIYSIQHQLFKYGDMSTIAVRIYDGIGDGVIYEGVIGLIIQNNYKKYFGRK